MVPCSLEMCIRRFLVVMVLCKPVMYTRRFLVATVLCKPVMYIKKFLEVFWKVSQVINQLTSVLHPLSSSW